MRVAHTKNTKHFLQVCSQLTYKEKDELEAKEIISGSFFSHTDRMNNKHKLTNDSGYVIQALKNAMNRWANHYLIYDKDKIVCTITLDINNNLHYFVTKDLTPKNSISFVKTIKQLAKDTLVCREVLFVTTRDWYKEAVKFNKLIGFKPFRILKQLNTTIWYLSNSKGL